MDRFGSVERDREYRKVAEERRKTESTPFILTSPEWLEQFVELIRRDEKYKKVARTWEGSCVLVFEADETTVYRRNIYIFLDLWHGECRWGGWCPGRRGRAGSSSSTAAMSGGR